MKISMIPNKIVKLIHASKGDTSLRKWAFEPYDNNGAINVSNIKDQLVYKTENGGTEQLLPVNTSTPTTSYFDGTINYGTDTDVEFTYKQSSYTGQARIKSIKGNTLVWNQLASFESNRIPSSANGITYSYTDGKSVQITGTATADEQRSGWFGLSETANLSLDMVGHKFLFYPRLISGTINGSFIMWAPGSSTPIGTGIIATLQTSSTNQIRFGYRIANGTVCTNAKVTIVCCDLTKMFGTGNEPTIEQFKSLFPLKYYAYNSGSLLNFNGAGIKTTGKNYVTNYLSDSTTANISWTQTDGVVTFSGKANGTTRTPALTSSISLKKGSYILSGCTGGSATTCALRIQGYINGTWGGIGASDNYDGDTAFTLAEDTDVRLQGRFDKTQTTEYNVTFYPMIRVSGTDSTFEPYTSSTLSLPISTYFPTGMKSAGSVYDELTESKAITRVGSVDLGSLTWSYTSDVGHLRFVSSAVTGIKIPGLNMIANGTCVKYEMVTEGNVYGNQKVGLCVISNDRLMLYDPSFTDASTLTTALSGVYLNYELAADTETDIQNASLVCKNIEVPCYLSSGNLACDATEELTNESGFFDAKLKLKDSSGVAYSSKFKLHVEDL